jgi:putative flippase GtrA
MSTVEERTPPAAEEPVATEARNGAMAGAADWSWELILRIHLGTRKPANWAQLFKFGVVGASGYVVNLAVFALLNQGAELHHIPAAIGAFCVAVTNNFLWNRHWTFQATEGHPAHQGVRFFAVSLIALGFNLALLEFLVSVAGMSEVPAQAISVAAAMPLNFVGNKLWTFG